MNGQRFGRSQRRGWANWSEKWTIIQLARRLHDDCIGLERAKPGLGGLFPPFEITSKPQKGSVQLPATQDAPLSYGIREGRKVSARFLLAALRGVFQPATRGVL